MGVTESIARWINETTYEDLPPEAVKAAKWAILDTLGVSREMPLERLRQASSGEA